MILSAIVVGLFSTPSFAMEGPASSNYSMREFRVTSGDVSLWASSVGESDNVLIHSRYLTMRQAETIV